MDNREIGNLFKGFPDDQKERGRAVGPFNQDIEKQGRLKALEDGAVPVAVIEDGGGRAWRFEIGPGLVRALAGLQGTPVRLIGTGTCRRDAAGAWSVEKLSADRFERLDGLTLKVALAHLRAGWSAGGPREGDPVGLMAELRGPDD